MKKKFMTIEAEKAQERNLFSAVVRTGSGAQTTKKGKRGYNRKEGKKELRQY
jgi:hypothetical protein